MRIARRLESKEKKFAYTVLALTLALVVIASLVVFISSALRTLLAGNSGPVWTSTQTQHPVIPTPTGTIDHKPQFPTPVTGNGSSTSSQPIARPTPDLQPTPTTSNDQGTLSTQIVTIPAVVQNKSQVQVDVQTNEPNVHVRLQVTYDTAPFYYSSSRGTTDDNGNATLNWNIRVQPLSNGNNAQATVVVIASNQNGQQAISQAMIVLIIG